MDNFGCRPHRCSVIDDGRPLHRSSREFAIALSSCACYNQRPHQNKSAGYPDKPVPDSARRRVLPVMKRPKVPTNHRLHSDPPTRHILLCKYMWKRPRTEPDYISINKFCRASPRHQVYHLPTSLSVVNTPRDHSQFFENVRTDSVKGSNIVAPTLQSFAEFRARHPKYVWLYMY